MNIIKYAQKYKNISYGKHRFNEVDSLVLCQISYQDFDNIYHNFDDQACVKDLQPYVTQISKNTLFPMKNRELIKAISTGKRFADLELRYFSYDFSDANQVQFAAMTFIGDDFAYICFRGTDITITGWKEDLLLAKKEVMPSQLLAKDYAEAVIALIPKDKKIYIGGHSKGGNLAIYASAFIKQKFQNRLTYIFDHDGPGFSYDIFETKEFKNISSKVKKTIPRNSLIGVILNDNNHAQIIKSHAITGLYQHDPFRWCIKKTNGTFISYTHRSRSSVMVEKTVDDILACLSEEEKTELIRTIGTWFDAAGIKTVKQIKRKIIPLLKSIRLSINCEENENIKKKLKLMTPIILKSVIYRPRLSLNIYKQKRIKHLSNENTAVI